jgi:hypothetical protein
VDEKIAVRKKRFGSTLIGPTILLEGEESVVGRHAHEISEDGSRL